VARLPPAMFFRQSSGMASAGTQDTQVAIVYFGWGKD
jgi:hypothetical protein